MRTESSSRLMLRFDDLAGLAGVGGGGEAAAADDDDDEGGGTRPRNLMITFGGPLSATISLVKMRLGCSSGSSAAIEPLPLREPGTEKFKLFRFLFVE